ncbi:protein FAR1-RELATED SEQUENCE 5-like [Hordeum vulgare subsp. vulgare]|uniref:protein FAR1-RELATED SEQUENCE 5-like n=1 Tax=Hordeum vulgare subsp. vulgare TaxID=112509 RepID=UPI001D1A3E7B|nr:protein FAR1-RELATED SEQUENCE 5-like [Hordeum vulgare subsp. vulgare]
MCVFIVQEDVDVENAKNNKDDSFYDNVNQEDINDCIDDDGEVEIDIAETEKLEKMLDTHCKVMEITFKSQGDAYMFYNNHAKERGFGIRKEKVKRGKGPAGIIRFRRFVCFRGGRRRRKFITMDGRIRRLRREARCDCGAHLMVKLDKARGVWFVAAFFDEHNHDLARPMREKRKLLAKGDADTAIGIMRSRKEKDPDLFFEYMLDKEGRLKGML